MNMIWKALGYETEQQQTARFHQEPSDPINNNNNNNNNNNTNSPATLDHHHQRRFPKLIVGGPPSTSSPAFIPNSHHPPSLLAQNEKTIVPALSSTSLLSAEELTREWTLMFSTNKQGRSFPRFVSSIGRIKGPSLIIIQEEDVEISRDEGNTKTNPANHFVQNTNNNQSKGQDNDNDDGADSASPIAKSSTQEEFLSPTVDLSAASTKLVPGNIFGFVTNTPWDNVKTREMNAKAAQAAKTRSARTGVALKQNAIPASVSSKESTPNQAPHFFGTSECFIFRSSSKNEDETVQIFYPRPSTSSLANGNFMYFFDAHPDSTSVGIGVGGSGARGSVGNEAGMAFFIDRSLARGQACPGGCITFQYSEQLSKTKSNFKIKAMEVWALCPEKIERDFGASGNSEDVYYEGESPAFTSPALSQKHSAAKVMLELAGGKIWSENNDREDV